MGSHSMQERGFGWSHLGLSKVIRFAAPSSPSLAIGMGSLLDVLEYPLHCLSLSCGLLKWIWGLSHGLSRHLTCCCCPLAASYSGSLAHYTTSLPITPTPTPLSPMVESRSVLAVSPSSVWHIAGPSGMTCLWMIVSLSAVTVPSMESGGLSA